MRDLIALEFSIALKFSIALESSIGLKSFFGYITVVSFLDDGLTDIINKYRRKINIGSGIYKKNSTNIERK